MSQKSVDPSKELVGQYLAVSFTEPARLLGVEVKMFQFNAFIAFFMVLVLKMLWWIPLAAIFHFILRWVTTEEPKMKDIYLKYQFQGDHYEPWGGIPPIVNKRPIGFGRDEAC